MKKIIGTYDSKIEMWKRKKQINSQSANNYKLGFVQISYLAFYWVV